MPEDNTSVILEGASRWDALDAAHQELKPWALKILKDGLDAYAKTIVVEPRYICKDHRDLYSNFYSKKFIERSSVCKRLHFFARTGISNASLLFDSESLVDDYIGFAVIRPVAKRCIGRTVIDPWLVGRSIKDDYFSLRTSFKTHISGQALVARGYPYMSQDGEATVCAHTALWGGVQISFREVYQLSGTAPF